MTFPLGIAEGADFCGRKVELNADTKKLADRRNLWIQGERRSGLTSYLYALQEMIEATHDTSSVLVDLSQVETGRDAKIELIKAFDRLGAMIMNQKVEAQPSQSSRYFSSIVNAIKGSKPKVKEISLLGMAVTFNNETDDEINQKLILAEKTLRIVLQGAPRFSGVLMIDSLEKLDALDPTNIVSGNLKTLLEQNHISVVLAGRAPDLIQQAEANKDLYALCHKSPLHRIPSNDWEPFIKSAFFEQYGFNLPTPCVKLLLNLTEKSTDSVIKLSRLLLDESIDELDATTDTIARKTWDALAGATNDSSYSPGQSPENIGSIVAEARESSREDSITDVLLFGWEQLLKQSTFEMKSNLSKLDQRQMNMLVSLSRSSGPMASLELLDSVPESYESDVDYLLKSGHLIQDKIGSRLRFSDPLIKRYISKNMGPRHEPLSLNADNSKRKIVTPMMTKEPVDVFSPEPQ